VAGEALVGAGVTGAAVVPAGVVDGCAVVDADVVVAGGAAVVPFEPQLDATSASAMPRHAVIVLQRMGAPIRS